MGAVIVIILVVGILLGLLASWICGEKGRSPMEGFLLGFFLGLIGVLIALLLPKSIDQQVKEAAAVQDALGTYARTGVLPSDQPPVFPRLQSPTAASAVLPQSILWSTVRKAASQATDPRREELQDAIQHLSSRSLLRGWCFAIDAKDLTSILLLFDDQMLRVRCTPSIPSISYDNASTGVQVHILRDEAGNIRGLGIGERGVDWFYGLGPPDALQTFMSVGAVFPWVEFAGQPVSTVEGPSAAPVPAPAPPSAGIGAARTADERAAGVRNDLLALKALHDEQLIDQNEYERRRAAILDRLTGPMSASTEHQ